MQSLLFFLRTSLLFALGSACTCLAQASGSLPDLLFDRVGSDDAFSQCAVQTMVQDDVGFIWMGTSEGLYRYDGYEFRAYKNDPGNPASISGNFISKVILDVQGRIWVGGPTGLDLYDAAHDAFVHYVGGEDKGLLGSAVTTGFVDRRGQLWIGTREGVSLYKPGADRFEELTLDKSHLVFAIEEAPAGQLWIGTIDGLIRFHQEWGRSVFYDAETGGLPSNHVYALCQDGRGGLWIGTRGGLARFLPEQNLIKAYLAPGETVAPVVTQEINTLYRSGSGGLWIGTRSEGLGYLDPIKGQLIQCSFDPYDAQTLPHNGVLCLLEDRFRNLWVGTDSGAAKVNQSYSLGLHHRLTEGTRLPGQDDVRAIEARPNGDVWLGTYGQGLTLQTKEAPHFRHFRHDPQKPNSLANDIVWVVRTDKLGRLWVGTDGGLSRKNEDGSFVNFKNDPEQPSSLLGNQIYSMFEDDSGRFWCGTDKGLSLFVDDQAGFVNHLPTPKGLSSGQTWVLAQGPNSRLWVGTGDAGLNEYDPERKLSSVYRFSGSDPNSLSNDQIYCLAVQSGKGLLWVGTHGGLNRMELGHPGRFQRFGEAEGLPSSTICAILDDGRGSLWISSKRGISCLNSVTGEVRNFELDDGLQGFAFNEGSAFAASDRTLYFGGVRGYNAFIPDLITRDEIPPKAQITAFLLDNNVVAPNYKDPDALLPASVQVLKELKLGYEHKMIGFEFTGIHLTHPSQNQFAYMLEGHDRDWIQTDVQRRNATYTNLEPGSFRFRVKAANRDGVWSDEAGINLQVGAPPWASWWAYLLYALLGLGLVGGYARMMRGRLTHERQLAEQRRLAADREQAAADQERKTVSRLREIDSIKGEFLANISHELRTPLNGIMGLAEMLRNNHLKDLQGEVGGHLDLILSSGKRLSFLINGLLDFGQLQKGSLLLNRSPVHLYELVEQVIQELNPLATQRNLQLRNLIDRGFSQIAADEKRLRQIFFNLGENGLKFSSQGSVSFTARIDSGMVFVSVSDTGVGIEQEQLGTIFESFRQADGSAERIFAGTGLGLTLTRQLVLLHGGEMFISSVLGEGTRVTFSLPLAVERESLAVEPAAKPIVPDPKVEKVRPSLPIIPARTIRDPDPKYQDHILVVDDEPINRVILKNLFEGEAYKVSECGDGMAALELLAGAHDIDMVLLDVMMPRLSGYEVCRRLRETYSTNELPVLMLTARNQEEDLIKGFDSGANDFLVKPFLRTELLSRVQTHLGLLRANRSLEGLVQERTRELRQKNESIVRWQQQLVMQERRVSLGLLTAGISHEINNPTSFVYAGAQNLAADLMKLRDFLFEVAKDEGAEEILKEVSMRFEELDQHLKIIGEGTSRIRSIVRDLHVFARLEVAELETVSLAAQVQSTVNLLSAQFNHCVQFEFDLSDPLDMTCHPSELSQVFMNILVNGCQSIEKRRQQEQRTELGTLKISTRRDGDFGTISFEDNGEGIPASIQDHIFEPFFTTKAVGEGTGLGLSISNDLVKKHGGYIIVESTVAKGSLFRIVLPIAGV